LLKYEIVVPLAICVRLFICRLRASLLRTIGDVTEAETHQAADVEVMKMHQWE